MKKLTPELKERILTVISLGGTREMAAHVAGCHRATIHNALKTDEEFAKRFLQAQESSELSYLMTVHEAANKGQQWRAAIWALERLYPERFAKRSAATFTETQMREVIQQAVSLITRHIPGKANREAVRQTIEKYADSLATQSRSKHHATPRTRTRKSRTTSRKTPNDPNGDVRCDPQGPQA